MHNYISIKKKIPEKLKQRLIEVVNEKWTLKNFI